MFKKIKFWFKKEFGVLTIEECKSLGLLFHHNVYGDEINRLNCRSIWHDGSTNKGYRCDSLYSDNELSESVVEPELKPLRLDEVPMIDFNDKDFQEKFDFEIWSTHSSSDYRNDRDRPYNGQSWTDDGERGKQEVKGLTMRDIRDCLIKAMLLAATSDKYLELDVFSKCWNWDDVKTDADKPKPTQYLLDRLDDPDFISNKVELGTWRPQDVYKIDFTKVDPIAICQNLSCEIEKMMGIFPNIKDKLKNS